MTTHKCLICKEEMRIRDDKGICTNEKCVLFWELIPIELLEKLEALKEHHRKILKRNTWLEGAKTCEWKIYRPGTQFSSRHSFRIFSVNCDGAIGLAKFTLWDELCFYCPYCGRSIKYTEIDNIKRRRDTYGF